ncbi:MAG: nucleotidyl transferase AbiEii/AbiGii toxin family protein [Planctomycetes bacterium]|nr:nucleotidyl transferase AbiEii/AbiGii toxin family protein [Planctomycetota bacterium]
MRKAFDRRVLPDAVLSLVRACQRRVECHLGGGAALSGAYLAHRLSGDVDLFCHRPEDVRSLVRALPDVAGECALRIELARDAGTFVRAVVRGLPSALELDVVYDPPDLEPPGPALEGVVVESLLDLRAAKLTCILSRSEPRDLVDLLFLDRHGFPPEQDLEPACRKDAGIDPGILAWLLGQFPMRPLPRVLEPLSETELERFRDELRERFRRLAVP